jgi:hypothetical protein
MSHLASLFPERVFENSVSEIAFYSVRQFGYGLEDRASITDGTRYFPTRQFFVCHEVQTGSDT